MKTLPRINRIGLALACAAIALAGVQVNAKDVLPIRVLPFTGNAGVTVNFAPTSDPAVQKATVVGVIQSSIGTFLDTAELEARFPLNPADPVLVNGTATWTSINGVDSLNLTVSGSATPDPLNPGFYNAKYQITITGGTGAYVSARGLAEIDEVVMFTSSSTATVAWNVKGVVVRPR